MRRLIPIAFMLATGLALQACSGSGTTPSAAPTAAPVSSEPAASAPASEDTGTGTGKAAVTIRGFKFGPANLTVAVGAKVTWTNEDGAAHTVTFKDGTSSGRLGEGSTFSRTFDTVGSFPYACSIHPSMTATVTVTQ